jgi:hypothetical protein
LNKTQERPLPKEMKISEFMKLPTREEHFEQIHELSIKKRDNENLKELVLEKEMEPCRMTNTDRIGTYMYGYSYEEPREKDIVSARLQATEDKVWIPTLKFKLEMVKIIDD